MSFKNANFSLAEARKEVMPVIIPIISVITILMFIGVIGNAAVIYIYGFVLKKTTVHYFIMVLAVFDFICCLLGFPLEITEVYNSMDYPSIGLCKWQRFLTFICSIGSGTVLFIISIERHRKVCTPTSYQLNLSHAKYFALGASFFSVLMASPMTIFASSEEIVLKKFGNLTGHDCHRVSRYGIWNLIYLIALLIYALIILVTMVVLYSLLLRTVRKHFLQSDTRHQHQVNNAEVGASPAKRQLSRTNHTVISITVLFAISFFPSLFLGIFTEQLTAKMSYKEEIVFFMFLRLFILNSSFNPVVYGFCNEHFRNAFVGLLRKIFCLSAETQSFSTETS